MEFVATFFRLGWLYLISPIRLCNNYALNDQQRLGGYMLGLGGRLLVSLAWKVYLGGLQIVTRARTCTHHPSPSNDSSGRARGTERPTCYLLTPQHLRQNGVVILLILPVMLSFVCCAHSELPTTGCERGLTNAHDTGMRLGAIGRGTSA